MFFAKCLLAGYEVCERKDPANGDVLFKLINDVLLLDVLIHERLFKPL